MKISKQYALYKGDTYLCGGTKEELAKYLGVKIHTITFYKSDTWLKRVEETKSKHGYGNKGVFQGTRKECKEKLKEIESEGI